MSYSLQKQCLDCGEELVGRSDKKFCSDSCRSHYNNKRLIQQGFLVRKVNAILLKNKRVLDQIANTNSKELAVSIAREMGFCDQYYTGNSHRGKQTVYHLYDRNFVFEEGRIKLTD